MLTLQTEVNVGELSLHNGLIYARSFIARKARSALLIF